MTYVQPVRYTVELVLPGGSNLVWEYNTDEYGRKRAQEMYDKLVEQRALMHTPSGNCDTPARWSLGVNLVVWDRHPGLDEAKGLILAQTGWEKE